MGLSVRGERDEEEPAKETRKEWPATEAGGDP